MKECFIIVFKDMRILKKHIYKSGDREVVTRLLDINHLIITNKLVICGVFLLLINLDNHY